MATIQRSYTKTANKLISYAEKRSAVTNGVNCPSEYAKSQFKATRELWGKNDGIQAHHVIQSFSPGEITAEKANEIGQQLVQKIADGYEAVVYTHTDKDHIHNHIVINSVNFENGYKYHAHGTDELFKIREASDELCKENNLSVVREKTAEIRYTYAEKALIENNKFSWKDDIRERIDSEREKQPTYESFKKAMIENHGIEVRERGKNITFINTANNKRVRGSRLGNRYGKEELINGFEKQITSRQDQERGNTNLSTINDDQAGKYVGIDDQIESNRGVFVNVPEGEHEQRDSNHKRIGKNQENEPANSRKNEIDFDRINRQLKRRKQDLRRAHQQEHEYSSEYDSKNGTRTESERNVDSKRTQNEQGIDPRRTKGNQRELPEKSTRIERDEPELS